MDNANWLTFFEIEPFNWYGILTCLLCGTLVGFERQLSGKPAGIRTSILICLSTYVFVSLSGNLVSDKGDPTRIIGQIVTGVGFLGGGVMLSKEGVVVGVTSAAVIWFLAATGGMIGLGFRSQAIIFTFIILGVLFGVNKLEKVVKNLKTGVHKDPDLDKI